MNGARRAVDIELLLLVNARRKLMMHGMRISVQIDVESVFNIFPRYDEGHKMDPPSYDIHALVRIARPERRKRRLVVSPLFCARINPQR